MPTSWGDVPMLLSCLWNLYTVCDWLVCLWLMKRIHVSAWILFISQGQTNRSRTVGILQKIHVHSALETTKRMGRVCSFLQLGWAHRSIYLCHMHPSPAASFHCLHSKVFHHFFFIGPILLLQQKFYWCRFNLSVVAIHQGSPCNMVPLWRPSTYNSTW